MLSMYTTESIGVEVDDDSGERLEALINMTTPTAGVYYLAIHRYSEAKLKDCKGNNIFDGESGLSGSPSANPICQLDSLGDNMSYMIQLSGDTTCTKNLVPTPVQNAAFDSSTNVLTWDAYTGSGTSIEIEVKAADGTTSTITMATTDTTQNLCDSTTCYFSTGVNELYIKAVSAQYNSAKSTFSVAIEITSTPTSAPTTNPTKTPSKTPTLYPSSAVFADSTVRVRATILTLLTDWMSTNSASEASFKSSVANAA